MTTSTQTREPARPPRIAQNAGTRHHPAGLLLMAAERLCLAGATGLAAAVAYSNGWNPGISLCALLLLWQFLPPYAPTDNHRGGTR